MNNPLKSKRSRESLSQRSREHGIQQENAAQIQTRNACAVSNENLYTHGAFAHANDSREEEVLLKLHICSHIGRFIRPSCSNDLSDGPFLAGPDEPTHSDEQQRNNQQICCQLCIKSTCALNPTMRLVRKPNGNSGKTEKTRAYQYSSSPG